MKTEYDWLVLGGGFRSIVAAYGLAKQGASVLLVEKSKQIGGFLSPIRWGDYWIDKGPQFFDNFEPDDVVLMNEMLGEGTLKDIGFSYSSYMAGQKDDRFAIPVWTHMGEEFARNAFQGLFDLRVASNAVAPGADANFSDVLNYDGGPVLSEYLHKCTEKFLCANATELSTRATSVAPFMGRKVLFDGELSAKLKASPLLDDILAAPKAAAGEVRYNLYPKGESLEVVRVKLEEKLREIGVEIMLETAVEQFDGSRRVAKIGNLDLQFGRVFLGPDLKDCERIILGTDRVAQKTDVLAEIFHCYSVPADSIYETYYTVDYDLGHLSSRYTNFSHYMGSALKDGLGVFCVEQPVLTDSAYWAEPEQVHDRIFAEAQAVGNVSCDTFVEAKSFRVPATYKVPRLGIDDAIASVRDSFADAFGDWMMIPDPFTLTRKQTIDDLRGIGVLR
ncbi:NAD(P)/FAD-dependent oxidoreductase [Pontivivens insulae]|uniref:Amine oxidase domain-containing protein n=1 Tax=Pontivivens insulae TaxID=1639689 RepID=A0A2R8A7H2_9RHOB|nr:NAD(P)/FAD-dependent oxidoreductase [Pontivivens insulae]RED18279.1 putative NAD(P)-binding protein [Pontivivens insulae]SPF28177.1 hypothetical protein POI8812_00475 [Pontivivens insulae]